MELLLIEESESDARLHEQLLLDALGARVHRVSTLAAAAVFSGPPPEVIVADLRLPDGGGLSVTKRLHLMHPTIPLLVLADGDGDATALECLRAGAQDYLPKSSLTTVSVAKAVLAAVQRKRFETQLERDLIEIIAAQEEAAGLQSDFDQLLTSICERTQRIVPATGAVVELPEGDEMVYRACAGSATPHVGLRVKISESLSGLAYTTSRILRCDDAEVDTRVDREACRTVGVRSMLVVPLKAGERTVGAIKALSTEPYAFSDLDIGKLRVLSNVLARLVTQATLYSEKQRLVDDLQRALGDIKTLSGLLPICSRCKKIRDDHGYWTQLEQYLGRHSAAQFTHSLCPTCTEALFGPELAALASESPAQGNSATPFAGSSGHPKTG